MLASGLLLVASVAFLSVLVLMSVWKQRKLSGKLPPGPTPLPFIGNYLQLNTEKMYSSLMKISQRYGPVFTIHLGPRRVVVLCGQEAVKEALVDQAEEFSGRGEQATFDWLFKGCTFVVPSCVLHLHFQGSVCIFFLLDRLKGNSARVVNGQPRPLTSPGFSFTFPGVAFSSGERAKQLRRFSIATLRDFGVGKRGIEERIQEEAGFLIESFRKTNGKRSTVLRTFYLSRTVSNVISSIVFGDRFDQPRN